MRVFLGGTCNGSTWREDLIPLLHVDSFNPVVEDWTPECQEEEIRQRQECDAVLYVLTPKITGMYAIAEVVDDSNKRPEKVVFCVLYEDEDQRFTPVQIKSLAAVVTMVSNNGACVCDNLRDVSRVLNAWGVQNAYC